LIFNELSGKSSEGKELKFSQLPIKRASDARKKAHERPQLPRQLLEHPSKGKYQPICPTYRQTNKDSKDAKSVGGVVKSLLAAEVMLGLETPRAPSQLAELLSMHLRKSLLFRKDAR